jgi:hypothetical protein
MVLSSCSSMAVLQRVRAGQYFTPMSDRIYMTLSDPGTAYVDV